MIMISVRNAIICIHRRNELMVLLKLTKTSFGDQGFRKKKIEDIIKRVGEIIEPETSEVSKRSYRFSLPSIVL